MRAWFVVALLTAAACASFGTSTPDVDGGSPDARGSTDGGGMGDASGDAGARFCQTFVPEAGTTLYCRDFDDGREALFDWTNKVINSPSGSVTLDTLAFTPPDSLLARLEPDASQCAYAQTQEKVGDSVSRARISFDARLGGNDTVAAEGATFMVLRLESCLLLFAANAVGGGMREQGGGVDIEHDFTAAFPMPLRWWHVDIDVDYAARTVGIAFDGMPGYKPPVTLSSSCLTVPAGALTVQPGLNCEAAMSHAREVRIDDLVVVGD